LTKQVFETKTVVPNHSTATDCFSTTDSVPFNSNKKDVESILFSFDLIIRTSKLIKTSHYNTYQYKLYLYKKTIMKNVSLLLIFCFTLTSCATIFTGTSDKIYFETKPKKAKVMVNGLEKCKTPCTTTIKRSLNPETVTLQLEGYETRSVQLEQSMNAVSFLNLFNILGWGIDAATGAMKKYDPKSYVLELDKE